MALTQLTLAQLQQLLAQAYSASAAIPANTAPGSQLGAIFNANALADTFVESQILYNANVARLATSTGADVDSFVNPFGVTRLPAVAAGGSLSTGPTTLSTASVVTGSPLLVPVGGILSTQGGLQYVIVADTSNAAYNATANGYYINVGSSSVIVTVQCLTAGSIGNVGIGQITQVINGPGIPAIIGITGVTNATAITGGADQETDAALKARFTLLESTGRVATLSAIGGAIQSVQPGLTYSIGDQLNPNGSAHSGYFSVFVAQLGTGAVPGSSLLNNVTNAVNAVRSAGISFSVNAPALVTVNASATITIQAGYTDAGVGAALTAALQAFVNNIGLNASGGSTQCLYGRVFGALYAVPGVADIQSLLVNAGSVDLTAGYGSMFSAAASPTWTFTN